MNSFGGRNMKHGSGQDFGRQATAEKRVTSHHPHSIQTTIQSASLKTDDIPSLSTELGWDDNACMVVR